MADPAQALPAPAARSAAANTPKATAVTPAGISRPTEVMPTATAPTASINVETPSSSPIAPQVIWRMPSSFTWEVTGCPEC